MVSVTLRVRPRAFLRHFSAASAPAAPSSIAPPAAFVATANLNCAKEHARLHAQSLRDPAGFWGPVAETFTWRKKWHTVTNSCFKTPSIKWFEGGELNITESALDRHIEAGHGSAPAVTWEADDGSSITFSYKQVLDEVNAVALVLLAQGVVKGDVVTLFMPMIPSLLFTMLACARIGAVHSVVFAGFSDAALAERITNGASKVVVTADAGLRGGRPVELKSVVDRAVVSGVCRVSGWLGRG